MKKLLLIIPLCTFGTVILSAADEDLVITPQSLSQNLAKILSLPEINDHPHPAIQEINRQIRTAKNLADKGNSEAAQHIISETMNNPSVKFKHFISSQNGTGKLLSLADMLTQALYSSPSF